MPVVYTTPVDLIGEARQDVTEGSHTYQIRKIGAREIGSILDLVGFLEVKARRDVDPDSISRKEEDFYQTSRDALVLQSVTSFAVLAGGTFPKDDNELNVRDIPDADKETVAGAAITFGGYGSL